MTFQKLKLTMLSGIIVAGLCVVAFADPLVIAVVNKGGNGVSVFTNDTVTDAEYAVITGLNVPTDAPGQTVLVLEEGKPPRWTNDSVESIDRQNGGDGAPQSISLKNEPHQTGDLIDLSELPDNKPIEVFGEDDGEPNVAYGIRPKDGKWRFTSGQSEFSGCGPMLPTQVMGVMPALPDEVRAMTFSDPFHPATDFNFDGAFRIDWQQTSPSEWVGVVQIPSRQTGAGVDFQVSMELELLSDTEVDAYSVVEVNLSATNASILQSSTRCTATTPMTMRYLGG